MANRRYSDGEILEMLRTVAREEGSCSPRIFDERDDTCSSSQVQRRFGSWTTAKRRAGADEIEQAQQSGYADNQILSHLRELYDREGKCVIRDLPKHDDLVSAHVVIDRFGSWSEAKEEAGLIADERKLNGRDKQYTDEDYLDFLRKCDEKHGKVTQKVFNADDEFPSSTAVRKRFDTWTKAKQMAGVGGDARVSYSREELISMLQQAADRVDGSLSANQLAAMGDLPAPETYQRNFGSWTDAKTAADVIDTNPSGSGSNDTNEAAN